MVLGSWFANWLNCGVGSIVRSLSCLAIEGDYDLVWVLTMEVPSQIHFRSSFQDSYFFFSVLNLDLYEI